MFHIRTTKTSSGAIAVQVVRYKNRKKVIAIHIGSAHNKKDLSSLKDLAADWIKKTTKQQELFPVSSDTRSNLIPLDKCKHLGIYYSFIYSVISKISFTFKFHLLQKPLLLDLALMRVIEPASKSRSLELLEEYFGIKHQRRNFYRQLPQFLKLKNQIESNALRVAKKHFNFDFSWVFYDVTTLYFESFGEDELRKPGFSKDNKANQPQILIGLVVNADGFPVAYEVFEGNKFEGHTLIPIITAFKNRHKIGRLTVVADAAMISFKNVEELNKNKLGYIVGARMGNLSDELLRPINSELKREDGATVRLKTKYGSLVCGFSAKRYRKDKHEMKKQIKRAEKAMQEPAKIKRMKFLKNEGNNNFSINQELIEKQKILLGIKGYYTNLPPHIKDNIIIKQYHNLWRVEQAFRVAKSDLEMRPIYHFKQQAVKVHVLICFMALVISKFMEIKTGLSLKQIIKNLKSVTDAIILNTLTGEKYVLQSDISAKASAILKRLNS